MLTPIDLFPDQIGDSLLEGLRALVEAYPLLLLSGALTSILLSMLLCYLRVPRPLPPLTRGALITSLAMLLLSAPFPPLLVAGSLGWLSVVMLLVVDEALLLHQQKQLYSTLQELLKQAGISSRV
ncbi:hypothetical protein [Hymenobacter mucosus]|uniref:Uncharacterized protein n=1 Tax=Hymenobacter mucosus TaxID=1411120 RepID=A0A239A1U2_9BACT|nr:hypothetical protein [Hymenobacter mucosus]SNR88873.1 hypothetical protein SAMN06269173_110100 [Hymenobacter mucosus]